MRYNSLNNYLKTKYGCKVYKLSLSSGLSCPNRDGTLSSTGCIFCSNGGSGEFASNYQLSITEQIESAKAKVSNKIKTENILLIFNLLQIHMEILNILEKFLPKQSIILIL